jgi:hypothetical protein
MAEDQDCGRAGRRAYHGADCLFAISYRSQYDVCIERCAYFQTTNTPSKHQFRWKILVQIAEERLKRRNR